MPRADRWFTTSASNLRRAPFAVREWVGWPDSLTERVAEHVGNRVQIRVVSERQDRLLADEQTHLGVCARTARIREVRLEVGGSPYVVARTVFPDSTARVMNHALRQLGTRSLGSLLFGALRAPVQLREFTRLETASALFRQLRLHLPDRPDLWARRALHLLQDRPLLVTEIFLPELWSTTPRSRERGSSD